jgi:hypothetical protein
MANGMSMVQIDKWDGSSEYQRRIPLTAGQGLTQ